MSGAARVWRGAGPFEAARGVWSLLAHTVPANGSASAWHTGEHCWRTFAQQKKLLFGCFFFF